MKTTDPRDPLDRKIDALLARRLLRPGPDFTQRVLDAVEEGAPEKPKAPTTVGRLLRYAPPIAAAIALTLILIQHPPAPDTSAENTTLTTAEMHEILLLEEGLSGLAQFQEDGFANDDLQTTLDALYFGIES